MPMHGRSKPASSGKPRPPKPGEFRLRHVNLLGPTLEQRSVRDIEAKLALKDLSDESHFVPAGAAVGPFDLELGIIEGRLMLAVTGPDGVARKPIGLSLRPLRPLIRDYLAICESYDLALQSGDRRRLEAVDMGRRGMHDDAARLLIDRLLAHIEVDHETARRLFTLVCALHLRH
jgi:uncharacterized protein (UPF0262 family)